MIAVSLFPEMKLKDAPAPLVTVMMPAVFAALPAQLQTEAVLLMADAGYGVGAIERLTGEGREALIAIGGQRHQVKAFQGDRLGSEAVGKREKGQVVSASGRLVLGHMVSQAGMLASSVRSLAYDLGISESSVTQASRRLMKLGFIERVDGETGRVCVYRLTRAGEKVSGFAEVEADA